MSAIYDRVGTRAASRSSSSSSSSLITAVANWSFLAGAGTVLVAWWIQEQRRRRQRQDGGDISSLLNDHELQLLEQQNGSSSSNSLKKCIYLDYNGTTPIASHVLKAMIPYLTTYYGNPSSGHVYGQEPAAAVNRARAQILTLLGQQATTEDLLQSIWFTACGTESDNMAIACALQANAARFAAAEASSNDNDDAKEAKAILPHIVTSNVEHPAITMYLDYLANGERNMAGRPLISVTYVPVQPDGRVKASDMIQAIRPSETILVTLMLANNETGALQPVPQVAQYCRQHDILFHTDAAQAAGKVSVDLKELGDPDMLSLVGHKLGAPKGVACLYVRPNCLSAKGRRSMPEGGIMLHGGGQEFGRRGGTPNVPYIVGMGCAAEETAKRWSRNAKHMAAVRAYLLEQLEENLEGTSVVVKANGPAEPHFRLPNTLSVGLKGIHSGQLLANVKHLVAGSAGATCHSTNNVSSVLEAMQVPMEYARGTLRLSVGPSTTFYEAEQAAKLLAQECKNLLEQNKETQEQME